MNAYQSLGRYARGNLSWRQFVTARDAHASRFATKSISGGRVVFTDGVSLLIPQQSALRMDTWGNDEWCRWRAIYGGIEPVVTHEPQATAADNDGRDAKEYRAALEELTGRNW